MAKTKTMTTKTAPAAKASASEKSAQSATAPRFQERYQKEIAPDLMKRFKHSNRMAVAHLVKIVLNIGCGEASADAKVMEEAQEHLTIIAGQRAVVTRARKAIANFKIKEGDPVGCKVTLRKQRMYEFLDRLITMALPRIRDFRGLSRKAFDQGGSYSFGIREQAIFPELAPDSIHYPLGMDIVLVTTAKTADEARALLEAFGFPFEKG